MLFGPFSYLSQQQLTQPAAAIGKGSLCFKISVKIVKIVLQSEIFMTATKMFSCYETCVPPAFPGLPGVLEDFAIIKYNNLGKC